MLYFSFSYLTRPSDLSSPGLSKPVCNLGSRSNQEPIAVCPVTHTVTVEQQGLSTTVKNQEDVTGDLFSNTSALFVSKMVLFKIQTSCFSGRVSTNPWTRLQDEHKRI